jgi:hypothetical protein
MRSLLRTGNRYLVIIRRGGAVGVGAGGEIVNVTLCSSQNPTMMRTGRVG